MDERDLYLMPEPLRTMYLQGAALVAARAVGEECAPLRHPEAPLKLAWLWIEAGALVMGTGPRHVCGELLDGGPTDDEWRQYAPAKWAAAGSRQGRDVEIRQDAGGFDQLAAMFAVGVPLDAMEEAQEAQDEAVRKGDVNGNE